MAKVDINILGNAIGNVAMTLGKLTDAIYAWISSSNVRRMQKCIRYGDLIVKRIKELKVEDKVINKYLAVWEKLNN